MTSHQTHAQNFQNLTLADSSAASFHTKPPPPLHRCICKPPKRSQMSNHCHSTDSGPQFERPASYPRFWRCCRNKYPCTRTSRSQTKKSRSYTDSKCPICQNRKWNNRKDCFLTACRYFCNRSCGFRRFRCNRLRPSRGGLKFHFPATVSCISVLFGISNCCLGTFLGRLYCRWCCRSLTFSVRFLRILVKSCQGSRFRRRRCMKLRVTNCRLTSFFGCCTIRARILGRLFLGGFVEPCYCCFRLFRIRVLFCHRLCRFCL